MYLEITVVSMTTKSYAVVMITH